jgi:hypothetical protein
MISECSSGHICFGKGDLSLCSMKDCGRPTVIISSIDIQWFYKINESGLCLNRKDLHMILEDRNMPKDVKITILNLSQDRRKKILTIDFMVFARKFSIPYI